MYPQSGCNYQSDNNSIYKFNVLKCIQPEMEKNTRKLFAWNLGV